MEEEKINSNNIKRIKHPVLKRKATKIITRKNRSLSDSDERNKSLNSIPIFRARNYAKISDEERINLSLGELELVQLEVKNKIHETQCKAQTYKYINLISSAIIIVLSGAITAIEATSASSINIPVIVLSSIIFATEGTHKLFGWGPRGVMYKEGNSRLRKMSRKIRNHLYFLHQYSMDKILLVVNDMRQQYDDIEAYLYKMSSGATATYNNGELDIEQGGGAVIKNELLSQNNDDSNPPSPHVHIHIDQSPNPSAQIQRRHSTPDIINNNNNNLLNVNKQKFISVDQGHNTTPPLNF